MVKKETAGGSNPTLILILKKILGTQHNENHKILSIMKLFKRQREEMVRKFTPETTELLELQNQAFEDGRIEGNDEGYEEGYSACYDEAISLGVDMGKMYDVILGEEIEIDEENVGVKSPYNHNSAQMSVF